jgi:hypothetical protein
MIKERKGISRLTIFPIWYLSVGTTLARRGLVLQTRATGTRDQGTLGSVADRYSRTPGRRHLFVWMEQVVM